MIYIKPFKKEDLLAFEPIEPLSKAEIRDEEFAKAIEDSGLAVTGFRDGKVIGCGGVHPILDSTHGELWLRLSKDCLEHKLDTLRWIKDGLEIIENSYPFDQLNAVIQCCFKQSLKMVGYLGFERMQNVTEDGKTWCIFSKKVQL